MTQPHSPNIRLTISVTPEVHETFQRLAKATGSSMGKAMGEWLSDTLEAAQFMTTKVEQARAAPAIVMREMHAYALGLADETGAMMEKIRSQGKASQGEPARAARPGSSSSPSSNTGGKGTRKPSSTRGKSS
jgi:hypothetical protein